MPGPTGSRWRSRPRSTTSSALEGRVYELIHRVNSMRKDAGLELTDRINLTLAAGDDDLLAHADWIAKETLAVEVEAGAERRARDQRRLSDALGAGRGWWPSKRSSG